MNSGATALLLLAVLSIAVGAALLFSNAWVLKIAGALLALLGLGVVALWLLLRFSPGPMCASC